MGNMLLRPGLFHRHGRGIKIIKADGTVMKLRSRVSVKEILIDYPNHGIFQAPASPRLGIGSFGRPLPERAGLVAGRLYYLIPLSRDELNNKRGPFAGASSDHSVPSSSSRLQPESCGDIGRNSIKQEEADIDHHEVDKINRGGVTIVSSSYLTDGSTLRLKLRLRKEDLASFLSAIVMENVVVPPSIQGATRGQTPWKIPSLNSTARLESYIKHIGEKYPRAEITRSIICINISSILFFYC